MNAKLLARAMEWLENEAQHGTQPMYAAALLQHISALQPPQVAKRRIYFAGEPPKGEPIK